MTEFMDRQIRLQRAGQKEYTEEEVRLIINGAIQEEREACARLCDKDTNPNADKYEPVSQYQSGCYITAEFLAAAIRARGQV